MMRRSQSGLKGHCFWGSERGGVRYVNHGRFMSQRMNVSESNGHERGKKKDFAWRSELVVLPEVVANTAFK